VSSPPPPVPPPAPPGNELGTASLIVGVIGLGLSFVPLVGVIAWPLVIIGLVLGILGLLRANRADATNRGVAIAGIVCSGAGLLVCLAWVVGLALVGVTRGG
jgi:hypothetical protein